MDDKRTLGVVQPEVYHADPLGPNVGEYFSEIKVKSQHNSILMERFFENQPLGQPLEAFVSKMNHVVLLSPQPLEAKRPCPRGIALPSRRQSHFFLG